MLRKTLPSYQLFNPNQYGSFNLYLAVQKHSYSSTAICQLGSVVYFTTYDQNDGITLYKYDLQTGAKPEKIAELETDITVIDLTVSKETASWRDSSGYRGSVEITQI